MYTHEFYGALPEEARLIRTEVFVDEQQFKYEFDDTDGKCLHMVLFEDGVPIATGRLIRESDKVYAIGRIAVRKPFRGKGLGAEVMKILEDKARQSGAERIWLSAQVRAKGFYESCGYAPSGETYFDEHVEHIHMEKFLK